MCVNGGCVLDERATFECTNDGFSGATANQCDTNSVCLHGSCYPTGCNVSDGGGCTAPQVCTDVTAAQHTFAVCLSGVVPLGSDCDPQTAKLCSAGSVCIDGNCK
jgi:hypothetical protein